MHRGSGGRIRYRTGKEVGLHRCLQRVHRAIWYMKSAVGTDIYCCRQTWGEHGGVIAVDEGLLLAQGRRNLKTRKLAGVRCRHVEN